MITDRRWMPAVDTFLQELQCYYTYYYRELCYFYRWRTKFQENLENEKSIVYYAHPSKLFFFSKRCTLYIYTLDKCWKAWTNCNRLSTGDLYLYCTNLIRLLCLIIHFYLWHVKSLSAIKFSFFAEEKGRM